jgi:predicted TIM-barrel enzyme
VIALPSLRPKPHALKAAIGRRKVVIGSGVTPENVGDILEVANGVSVASWLKHDGVWWNEVDPGRLATRIAAANRARA